MTGPDFRRTRARVSVRARRARRWANYVVSPFEQDEWLALDESVDAGSALAAYQGMRRMNLALFRSLTAAQRSHRFEHPERGTIDVEWMIAALAGHERRHLRHLQAIADLDD